MASPFGLQPHRTTWPLSRKPIGLRFIRDASRELSTTAVSSVVPSRPSMPTPAIITVTAAILPTVVAGSKSSSPLNRYTVDDHRQSLNR